MNLKNLDDQTRRRMEEEAQHDIAKGVLYMSKRFSPTGAHVYPNLLLDAIRTGDEETLANALKAATAFVAQEPRTRNGKTTLVAVPYTAADTFAEGEFNRFYIRGLCVRAIEDGDGKVVVYRAKEVASPRSESQAKVGAVIDAAQLLEDLRNNPGVDTALGLPAGPNSGLSVALR